MSGAVGSTPSFTRRGRPSAAARCRRSRSSSSETISAVPFFKRANCSSTLLGETAGGVKANDGHHHAQVRFYCIIARGQGFPGRRAGEPARPQVRLGGKPACLTNVCADAIMVQALPGEMSMSKQDSPVSPQRGSKGGSKKGRRRLRPWRLLLLVLIFTFLLTGGAGVGVMAGILKDLPSVDDLSYMQTAESSFIYDRHGNLITELHGAEDREFIKFEDIPPHVKNAFLAIEDHRFYHHFGIDIGGIFRALWNNLRGGHTQGASTITQQLARTIFPIGREVTLRRKIQEAILAIQLERRYIKDEIFEMYLNQIF